MATVLTLAPAFGGARFGPFPGAAVSIGSDTQCQVCVSAAMDVLPIHAWVTEEDGRWTLHPGAPGAVIFVSRSKGRLAPLNGPVALAAGDGFALARADGVSFVIGRAPEAATTRAGPRRGPPTTGALATEAGRMMEVEWMRVGPVQEARRAWFRFKGGTFFQPRYILTAVLALASGGIMACTGAVAALWTLLSR